MALQEKLKKITIPTVDSKGLYFKDIGNLFSKKELGKNDLKKLDYENIDIVIKFYFKNKQIKKTIKYTNITGLQAVKKASATRSELKYELDNYGIIKKNDFKSLNDFFTEYIKLKTSSLSKNNIYSMTKTYNKWIKNTIGDIAIDKIFTTDIQPIINIILAQGLAPRTAQSIQQILRPIFNYAIDLELLIKNPVLKINIPKFDNTVNFELSESQRKKLFKEILNYEYPKYKGIMLFLYLGRRLNEVLTLKWEDIDFNKELKSYTIEDINSKIRKQQEYPLSKPLEQFLKEYGIQKKGYIFKGEKTIHVTSNTFRKHWKEVLKQAKISKMRIHDTRHLLGNTLINKGVSEDIIAKTLGHQSFSITSRYSKIHINTINEALNIYLED